MNSDKLLSLSSQFAYASGVKEAAKLRSQCTLEEWQQVLAASKEIYRRRMARHFANV